jgi:hypothetical protein
VRIAKVPVKKIVGVEREAKPLAHQESEWARAVNRRVEFEVKAR